MMSAMVWGAKTWFGLVALGALLVAVALAACGGGSDTESTTTSAPLGQAPADGSADAGSAEQGSSGSSGKEGSGTNSNSDAGPSESGGAGSAAKQHDDSGGGSKQFRVLGNDNSVQDFGKESGSDEFEEAAAALHGFLDARVAGQWAAACDYLASEIAASLEKLAADSGKVKDTGCPSILSKLTNPGAKQGLRAEARKADVGSLRVEGNRGFVLYRGTEGMVLAIPMKRDDGEWKVASLAGSPVN